MGKTELEGILKEHKEHLDVVRKLAKKVAKLNNSSLLHGLKMQMFNLINFEDPERGFSKVIEVIEVKLKEKMKKEMIKRIVKKELKEEMKKEKEMIKKMVKKELKEKMKKKTVMRKKKEIRKKMKM